MEYSFSKGEYYGLSKMEIKRIEEANKVLIIHLFI